MLRGETLRGVLLLLSNLPVTMAVFFVGSPDVVRGDVTGSAALEWTLQSEPGEDDFVGFTFNGADVFRYTPYTGVIPPRVVEGPDGNPEHGGSYDPRFTIYNTSTRGVGFRLTGLRAEDAGNYTCTYNSLTQTVGTAVLFVYDVPGRPVIGTYPQTLVDGLTSARLNCGSSSTSLPAAYRHGMSYRWKRNGVDVDKARPPEILILGSGRILLIRAVSYMDRTYTCTSSEIGTQLTSEETEITLDILHGPYNLTLNPPHLSARENEALEVTASANCNPVCNYTWSTTRSCFCTLGPVLRFDSLLSRDATNYTLRVENDFGTANLTVEVTLDDTEPEAEPEPEVPSNPGDAITWALAAVACISLTINVVVATVAFRRGLFSCREGNTEPGNPVRDYVISGSVREPDNPALEYINASFVNGQGRAAGNQSPDMATIYENVVQGLYEPVDQQTREPARPADKVYATLRGSAT